MPNIQPVLKIENITISYKHASHEVEAVRDFSLTIDQGQTYGLVGESGSGKTTLALAVMNYLNKDGYIKSGDIQLNALSLTELDSEALRKIWGSEVAHVPQNPFTALNPSMLIGEQIAESLRLHRRSYC